MRIVLAARFIRKQNGVFTLTRFACTHSRERAFTQCICFVHFVRAFDFVPHLDSVLKLMFIIVDSI